MSDDVVRGGWSHITEGPKCRSVVILDIIQLAMPDKKKMAEGIWDFLLEEENIQGAHSSINSIVKCAIMRKRESTFNLKITGQILGQ